MDALIGLNREEKKFQIKPWDKTEKAKHIPEHKHIYNKKTDWVLTYVTCFGPANQTEQSRSCIRNNSILMSNPYFVGSSQRKWSSPTESLIHTLHYHSELKWLTKTWLLWGRCSSCSVSLHRRSSKAQWCDGWYGSERLVCRRWSSEQARYSDSEISHGIWHCNQLGWHGKGTLTSLSRILNTPLIIA